MKLLIAILSCFICFTLGISYGYDMYEPKTITEYVQVKVPMPYEVEVIREVPVEVVTILTKEIATYPEPTHWKSFTDLYNWGVANAVEPMGDGMCLYEAIEMQKRAYEQGKILSIEMLFEDTPRGHAVCSGVTFKKIGDELIPFVYIIEPTVGKAVLKATAPGVKLGGYYTEGDVYPDEPIALEEPDDGDKPDKPDKPKKPKKDK